MAQVTTSAPRTSAAVPVDEFLDEFTADFPVAGLQVETVDGAGITISAPTTASAVGSVTASISQSRQVTTSAPSANLSSGTASSTSVTSASVTLTSPAFAASPGAPSVASGDSTFITTEAPSTEALAADPTVETSTSATVLTLAPSTSLAVGSPYASVGEIGVVSATLKSPDWSARFVGTQPAGRLL